MPDTVDAAEAAIARLTQEDLAALPPARLRLLSDRLYNRHVLCELAAGAQPFPRVVRNDEVRAGWTPELVETLTTYLWALGPATVRQLPPDVRRRLKPALEAAHRAMVGADREAPANGTAVEQGGVMPPLARGDRAP
jgi:hypothetical protein